MVNKQVRSPGEILRFEPEARISGDVPSAAVYTGQAWEALASVAGGLSQRLGQMADRAAQREGQMAGLSAGQAAGAAYLQATSKIAATAGAAGKGPWIEQAKALLRNEEGFRPTPYWDTNAYRVGYGSDTHVTADGKIVRVQPGAKISKEDAERDLEYRLTQREGAQVQKQLGATWDKLSDSARAGLASVGYNYGSLPKSVVAAAETGDPMAIAAAVAALPANKARRQREAALIRGGGMPSGVSSETTASITPSQPVQAPPVQVAALSTKPLALRRDGTIRGDAFDDAASSAYAWRMQETLSNDLFAAHQQFSEDPEQFATAVSEIRARYGSDPNLQDPFLREAFDKSFTQRSEAYVRDVAAKHEARLRLEQEQSFADGLQASTINLERQAQVLGADQQGDHIVTRQVAELNTAIDAAVSAGTITPAQASKHKADIAETAARGRIQGVFEALPSPEQKEQFSLELLDEWRSGEGPLAALPYDTVKALSDTLRRDAREQINTRLAANKAEAARLATLADDDVASIQETGKGIDPSSGLTVEAVRATAGEAGVVAWQAAREKAGKIYDATNGMEKQSADDILERLALIKPKAGKPGYADDLAVYELAQKKAQDVLKERQTDPLGQAARAGVVEITAIDPTSADSLTATLTERRQAQTAVAGLYGQSVPVFRPGEKEMLTSALATNPEALPAFAFTVRKVYGKDAPRVIAEISEDAPVIAHAAGLSLATGDNSVAADVANALGMKREKLFTAKMPSQGEITAFASSRIGGAFMADPRTQNAVIQTAAILFEHAANSQGFDPSELKTEGSVAQAAFSRALDRAAGARSIGGVTYGGIAEVNGGSVIVPADMPKDRPQELMRNLTEEQLAKLPPIDSGDFDINIAEIRGAHLVSDGDGIYRVALGDPLSEDPRYLAMADGNYWRLDIRQLETISAQTPGNPLGFSGSNFNPFGWQPGR